MLLMGADQALLLEPGEGAAYRFQFHSQIVADFLARHAQIELRGRVTSRLQALGQIKQEGCHALFRAHVAEQQNQPVFANDLSAHHLVEMALNLLVLPAQLFQMLKGDDA